ncbi:MAG: hypothetical protein ACLUEV_11155 [Alistipes sp.]
MTGISFRRAFSCCSSQPSPSISLLEVIVLYMTEELRLSRKRAIFYTASAITVTDAVRAVDDARFETRSRA